jgi:methylenetetrahydrofolate dehydrogenase (NADP+)/methenyltetrahydrofolate cyclohydrolase
MVSSVTTTVVDGTSLARDIRSEIAAEVAALVASGRRAPCLAVVLVGDDPASASYIAGKRRASARAGMASVERKLPASAREDDVLSVVRELNEDDGVDGILVQLPLPPAVDPERVAAAIDPAKDVDGLHPLNSGRLLANRPGLYPCTPLGILEVLDRHGVKLEGTRAVVIGRSAIVGKPVALMLLHRSATVTIAHSRTRDLPALCREADVLVAAVGRARLVQRDWVKPGAAVIDVGVNAIEGRLVGDVDFDGVLGVAGLLTPPRGGIGPMTITMLLRNTVAAYRMRAGDRAAGTREGR